MGLATIDPSSQKELIMSGFVCISIHFLICKFFTFLNACIAVQASPINTELGDFVNLGVLFLTMWINSCLSNNLQTRTEFFSVSNQAIWLTDLLYLEILCSRREMTIVDDKCLASQLYVKAIYYPQLFS